MLTTQLTGSNKETIKSSLSWVDSLRASLSYLFCLFCLSPNRDTRLSHRIYIYNMNHKIVEEPCVPCFLILAIKMRVKVSVLFKELVSLTDTLRQLKEFLSCGKPKQMQRAKSDSDIMSKMCATFADKQKKEAKTMEQTVATNESLVMEPPDTANTWGNSTPDPRHFPPNCILFLNNSPEETHGVMLSALRFSGFRTLGSILGKHDTALVEFENGGLAGDVRWAG